MIKPRLRSGLGFLFFLLFYGQGFAGAPEPLVLPPGEIRAVLSAESVNQELINQGRATGTTLPFASGTPVYEIRLTRDLFMVRTYLRDPARLKDGAVGSWVMSPGSLRGVSPLQVRDSFALPALNDYLTTVKVPAGTILRLGSAGPIAGWGDGGGQQILLITRLPLENYQWQRPLVEQNLLFAPLVPKGNPGAAAAYLDTLPQPEAYSDWSVVNLLLGYLTHTPLTQALNQIGPERYDTLTQIDIQNIVQFNKALLDRRLVHSKRSTSAPGKSGTMGDQKPVANSNSRGFEIPQNNFSLWGKALGSFGRQDGSRDHSGFEYQTGTFLAGIEKKARENILFGGGLNLSRTGFSWTDNLGDGNISQVNLGLYGTVVQAPLFFDGALVVGFQKADISRRIRFPGVDRLAASNPDGYNLAASLDSGLNQRMGEWDLEPLVRLSCIYQRQNALLESGADSLNLKIDQIESRTWRGEGGVRLSRTASLPNGFTIIPELWLGFGYQQPLDNREIKASLNGQTGQFSVNGTNSSSGSFMPRLGMTVKGWGKTSLFLVYAGDFRSDFMGHTFNAGLEVAF